MAKFNIQGLINNISEKNTVYTPIVEAVVNSIQSIEESSRSDRWIKIIIKRGKQAVLAIEEEDSLPKIKSIEIQDNGEGFTDANRESFDTLYSNQKVEYGGKGFGRFMFLKYFEKVRIDSTYKAKDKYYRRTFSFSGKATKTEDFIENENISLCTSEDSITKVMLDNIKEQYANRLDKKLETIARNLVEKLLPYFINDKYSCPTISLGEADSESKIILNNFFKEHDGINRVASETIVLRNDSKDESFEVKVFKVYYTQSPSSIILTAHNRAVTITPLHDYIPEFKDDFYEIIDSGDNQTKKNYSIKAYVLGSYLNTHVSLERHSFAFGKTSSLFYPLSQQDIESHATDIVVERFKDDVVSRQQKKKKKIRDYVDKVAPWHKSYFDELDVTKIPYNFDEANIEAELQKMKFQKDQSIRKKVSSILEGGEKQIADTIDKLSKELNELGKSDLAHYVVLRKVVLELLNKSLRWNKTKNYEKEKVIHNMIFPMNTDSDNITYDKHNLWILDERLSFHEYVASDKPLNGNDERPDLLIFDKSIVVREGNEFSNPLTIFEFKRPQREQYTDEEDPINQILKYVDKIRKGNFKDIAGRNIKADNNTPAYGFLVCDLTDKIKEFCKRYSLTMSPDQEGYFGYQSGYNVYLEVISFDKLIKDAELRNKIFFKKLNIE